MENIKLSKIIKVGNSLAVVIPKNILLGLKMQRGDQVVFAVYDEDTVCFRRVSPEELLKLRPQDVHF